MGLDITAYRNIRPASPEVLARVNASEDEARGHADELRSPVLSARQVVAQRHEGGREIGPALEVLGQLGADDRTDHTLVVGEVDQLGERPGLRILPPEVEIMDADELGEVATPTIVVAVARLPRHDLLVGIVGHTRHDALLAAGEVRIDVGYAKAEIVGCISRVHAAQNGYVDFH